MTSSLSPQALQESVDGLLSTVNGGGRKSAPARELARGFFSSDEGYLEERELDTQLKQWQDFEWADTRKSGDIMARAPPTVKANGYIERTVLQTVMTNRSSTTRFCSSYADSVAPLRAIHPIRGSSRTRGQIKNVNPRPGEALESRCTRAASDQQLKPAPSCDGGPFAGFRGSNCCPRPSVDAYSGRSPCWKPKDEPAKSTRAHLDPLGASSFTDHRRQICLSRLRRVSRVRGRSQCHRQESPQAGSRRRRWSNRLPLTGQNWLTDDSVVFRQGRA